MSKSYILVDGEPVQEHDAQTWALWFENADRIVARLAVADGVEVSTVFLGIDHSFRDGDLPVLFETMVFGGELDEEMERYSSLEDAQHGHDRMVKRVRAQNHNWFVKLLMRVFPTRSVN